jgi:hypothetical protein
MVCCCVHGVGTLYNSIYYNVKFLTMSKRLTPELGTGIAVLNRRRLDHVNIMASRPLGKVAIIMSVSAFSVVSMWFTAVRSTKQ